MPQVRQRVDLPSSERNLLPVNHKFHHTRHFILHNINSNTLIAQRRPKSKYHICSIHSVPTTKRPVGLAGNSAVETTANFICIRSLASWSLKVCRNGIEDGLRTLGKVESNTGTIAKGQVGSAPA